MKRRNFLGSTLATAAIARAGVAPSPAFAVHEAGARSLAGADSRALAGAAEADWAARSTAPGVLWAHDFRHDAEFYNFHKASPTPYADPETNPKPIPYHATLVATPFGASRAIESVSRGTRLMQDIPAAPPGTVQEWKVEDIEMILEPWDGGYRLNVRVREIVILLSRDVGKGTITVRRTKSMEHPAGSTIGSGPQGRWIRPTAALRAGGNGKPTDDHGCPGTPGGASARRARDWDPADRYMHVRFREGYFGHRSYWDPQHGDARYKDWVPRTDTFREKRIDAWEGDEFWLQFRARISPSLVRPGAPSPKMIYIQNCTTSGNGQLFWNAGPQNRYMGGVPDDWPHGKPFGRLFTVQRAYGDSTARFGQSLSIRAGKEVYQQDPVEWPLSYGTKPRGWCFPAGKWVTYLVHMKPGRDSMAPVGVHSRLVQALPARVFGDKSADVMYLADVSMFPDVNGPGNYEYTVHTAKRPTAATGSAQLHEHMTVIAIDRAQNTLTVRRNAMRDWTSIRAVREASLGWDAGAPIAYGIVDRTVLPGNMGLYSPHDAAVDPRVGYPETTVEVFVAVEGERKYRRIVGGDRYKWMYGDQKGRYLNYEYNPPALNSIELSQYMNDYVGSGAIPPGDGLFKIQYTQAIMSREFIPPPLA